MELAKHGDREHGITWAFIYLAHLGSFGSLGGVGRDVKLAKFHMLTKCTRWDCTSKKRCIPTRLVLKALLELHNCRIDKPRDAFRKGIVAGFTSLSLSHVNALYPPLHIERSRTGFLLDHYFTCVLEEFLGAIINASNHRISSWSDWPKMEHPGELVAYLSQTLRH